MHHGSARLLALSLVVASRLLHAAEVSPVEAFGTVPQVDSVSMSPDGNLLAWYDLRDGQSKVVLFDLNTRKYKRVVPLKQELTMESLSWADSHTLLATLSYVEHFDRSKKENFRRVYRTQAMDVESGEAHTLLMDDVGKRFVQDERAFVQRARFIARRPAKPNTVIMSRFGRFGSSWVSQVFEVDTRTGKGTSLDVGSAVTVGWIADRDGKIVARIDRNSDGRNLDVLVKDGDKWRALAAVSGSDGLMQDGKALVAMVEDDKKHISLVALPLDGSKPTSLVNDAQLDVESVIHDPATGAPVGAWLGGPEEPTRWFDADAERRFNAVSSSFPGKAVNVLGRSDDNRRAVVEVWSASTPLSFYVIDFEKHTAESIGDTYPALAGKTLGPMQKLSYKARDGADVPAYLTLPANAPSGTLPLVVLPHDGPGGRDSLTFDWLAQFIAAHGYAVLQPQFRGSSGFGEAWSKAGERQWGLLMQDDLTDGVKALVDKGVADARRVCIVGIGYGGYAALAGAAFTPTTYRCAASINGISDLPGMLHYTQLQYPDSRYAYAWVNSIGSATQPQVLERSPRSGVEQIRIPILLLHAQDDIDVPFSQSLTMARYMEMYGKKATLVSIPNADHELTQSTARQQVLAAVGEFLDANLKP